MVQHENMATDTKNGTPRGFTAFVVVLARWRAPIFFISFGAAFAGAAYLWFFVPNQYESKASIKSASVAQLSASGFGSLLSAKGVGDIGGMLGMAQQRSDLDQYVAVLESESVLREVVKRFDLQREYGVKYSDDALKTFHDHVKFSSMHEAQLLSISVQDTSPRRAQRMCAVLVELLDSVNKNLARRNAQNAREYLELRYRQCAEELATAEDSLRIFQIRNKIYDMKDQATASIKVAAELEGQIVLKEVQANVASRSLGGDDADTRRLFGEVDELKKQRRQLDTGLNTQSAFQSIIPFGNAPQLGMEFFRRYRDVEIQQKLFALLFPMMEQARVDEERNTPTLLVLDAPSLPERKSGPKRTLLTVVVFFIAFIVAYCLAWLLEKIRRFRANDIEAFVVVRTSLSRLLPSFIIRWFE